MRRRDALRGGLALATGALAGCADLLGDSVTESFERDYPVDPETVVAVTNRNGDVTVRQGEGDRLRLTGEKRASSEDALETITVDVVTGERFVVDVRFESGSNFESRAVALTVELPAGVAVDEAATSNGDVTVSNVSGDLTATTSNGSVDVSVVDGYVRAETSNGDVTVRGTTGLRGARSANGDVEADLLALRGDVTCETDNGSVTVRAGPTVSAGIRLRTDRGEVAVVDLPHEVETRRNRYLAGSLRGGSDPLVTLRSSNGDVTLEPLE